LIHFQQDRTPPHYHRELRQFLGDLLPRERDQSLGLRRLPQLNHFFWGYVKEHVCIAPLPNTINKLKKGISETIESVNGGTLRGTMQETEYRLDVCRVTIDAHMENL
jgi:hypothetical protein